jgi:RNA polymerase I-specific transcription initiation factor RRN6
MTDHTATDLSYGHLGEATYDIETGEWRFSLDPFSQNIQQLLPLRSGIPSIQSSSSSYAFKDRTKSTKSLVKSQPETFPANPLLSSLAHSQAPAHSEPHVGQLLAVGKAVDVEQTFGSRKTTIIATSCGQAGHVLRLIKPRIERHEWGRQSSTRLSLLDTGSSDHGYWVGIGGRILQTVFAEDRNSPTTWLAVRQASSTTIFRPVYSATTTPAVVPNGYTNLYLSSRLNANPVAVLTAEQSGSRSHVDVTFNPWYTQQFAVVDQMGSWTTWDIEGGRKKHSTTRLIPGKRANIYDGYVPDPTLKAPDNADSWHQIWWVGSVSTIFVCSRRHVAVFDVKAAPIRLSSRGFFKANNSDWILDVKRSPSNLSHLFVLTSSRIYWLEVIPAGEEKDSATGFKVILSYRHFRAANDRTMRLSILNDEDGKNRIESRWTSYSLHAVSVSISSGNSSLVNFYTFFANPNGLGDPTSCHGSLNLSNDMNNQEIGVQDQLQTLHFLRIPLTAIPNRPPGPELQYLNIKFYQILVISSNLGLSSGLCAVQLTSPQGQNSALHVTAPTRTYIHTPGYMSSKRVIDDPWVIANGRNGDENLLPLDRSSDHSGLSKSRPEAKDYTRLTINFRSIYQHAFNDSRNINSRITDLLENVLDRIRQGKETDELAMSTFLDLAQIPGFTEDLEQGAPVLRNFLESLKLNEEPDSSSSLVLSNLTLCPGIGFQTLRDSQLPDLLKVYDQVAENWISNLPLRVSGLTRLAKFKIARKVAVELCLSSIGISLCNKSSQVPTALELDAEELPALNRSVITSREGSPAVRSSQILSGALDERAFGLPTPAQTPSLYSQSHASASEYAEDPAISRLRQYAVSIKAKPDLGSSKILFHWPQAPGVDPATYSWGETQKKAAADESGEETDHGKRREAARRKRTTERFLSRESTAAVESYSQPTLTPFRSQPDVGQYPASSQTIADDVPMTQPDRGAFGSRSAQQGKQKQKKKRTAGFR